MDETAKECLKALVDTLGLAVGLRVIAGTHAQGYLCELEEFLPKGTGKDLVPIGDNGIRQPMKLLNVIKENFGDADRCKWVC